VLDRLARAKLARVLGPHGQLVWVSTIGEMRDALDAESRVGTVISEARDLRGVSASPLLREVRQNRPSVALIGYCARNTPSPDLLALANAGIDELVQEGVDDEGVALRAAYRGSIEARAARAVLSAIASLVPATLLPVVEYCLRYPREDHSVLALARAHGVDRKTLLNHASRNAFFAPSTLAMWCRIMLAAALLETTRDTVEQIAFSLEFASPSAFRNACRRYTGQRPSTWRAAGGLEGVVELFRAAAMRSGTLLESGGVSRSRGVEAH
jgi:AraC-like DNA-binding protein